MEFQEWYLKNEKELFEEFANVNGWGFSEFCQREFDRGVDWANAIEIEKDIDTWALMEDEAEILNKCLGRIFKDGRGKDIKDGDTINFKIVKGEKGEVMLNTLEVQK